VSEQPQQPESQSAQWVELGEGGVTTETLPRHVQFVRVSPAELEDLKSSNSTLELAFFALSVGCLITIFATLGTVAISDPSTHAAFVAAALLFILAALYFGIAAIRGELRWRRKIDSLKNASDKH
jgi:hypothetical protein